MPVCHKDISKILIKMTKSWILNENYSIKAQLLVLYSGIIVLSVGIALAISLSFVTVVGDDAYTSTRGSIIHETKVNSASDAREISFAVEKQLLAVVESMSMVNTYYSSLLLQSLETLESNPFVSKPTFREYNFEEGCSYPGCPQDYGYLKDRSRVPKLSGSLLHTSTSGYNSALGNCRNDSAWTQFINASDYMPSMLDILAIEDDNLQEMYSRGPNTTVFYYIAVKLNLDFGYNVIQKVYPGIARNGTSPYDASQRDWFINAPIDNFYMYGPYKETFSGLHVINFSSKKYSVVGSNDVANYATIVSASLVLLSSLTDVITNIDYPHEGFGAILKYQTLEVLCWSTEDTYNYDTYSFYTIYEWDANLASHNLKVETTFDYVDPEGVRWVVSVRPFLTSDYNGVEDYSLIMLVMSKWSSAVQTLPLLHDNIDSTVNSVTTYIVIICAVVTAILIGLLYILVIWLTKPLVEIQAISKKIIQISSEEEKERDYSGLVQSSWMSNNRSDEIGILGSSFWKLVCQLHNNNVDKKSIPKYRPNPFHADYSTLFGRYSFDSSINNSLLTCQQFIASFQVTQADDVVIGGQQNNSNQPKISEPGDILQQLSMAAHHLGNESHESHQKSGTDIAEGVGVGGDVEMGNVRSGTGENDSAYTKVKDSDMPEVQKSCITLKIYLYAIGILLVGGLLSVMIITIITLRTEGYDWMTSTGNSIEDQQMINLDTITGAKSVYMESFFRQAAMDTAILGRFATSLFDGNLTDNSFYSDSKYAVSYSVDPTNAYAYYTSPSYDVSGYFVPESAKCYSETKCLPYQTSAQTELTTMLDNQFKAYFHALSSTSFAQVGTDDNGFSRALPYEYKTYGEPTTCYVSDTTYSVCANNYYNSQCSDPNSLAGYPAYDSRCRAWYQFSILDDHTSSEVYFQYPRTASNGEFVLTSVIQLRQNQWNDGLLYGVLNVNTLAQEVSDAFNSYSILDSGYAYVIDLSNLTYAVIHPYITDDCSTLRCGEHKMSDDEFRQFQRNVLIPMQNRLFYHQDVEVSNSYDKDGKKWKLSYHLIELKTIHYAVIATVPLSEIMEPVTKVEQDINSTVVGIIVAASITMAFFICLIIYAVNQLVTAISKPILNLVELCDDIISGKLHHTISTEGATSYDMFILLSAFSNLLTALRFGSDSYAVGDVRRAMQCFTDSLALFTASDNKKGIGASHNNLGAVFTSMKSFAHANEQYDSAIHLSEKICNDLTIEISKLESENNSKSEQVVKLKKELQKGKITLSDRKGNLAMLRIEEGRFPEAYAMFESMLESDKQMNYIKGCVVKQGNLGYLYLKQNEIQSAERIFLSALSFVTASDKRLYNDTWDETEASVALQISLFNISQLFLNKNQYALAEHFAILSLQEPTVLHLSTLAKSFQALQSLQKSDTKSDYKELLEGLKEISERFNFILKTDSVSTSIASEPKRIVVAVDYSGSMSGGKIKAAVSSLKNLVANHISADDSIMLMHFNQACIVDFQTTRKRGNEKMIDDAINTLTGPNGSTCLFDAIELSFKSLAIHASSSDWMIVLTDGADNGSKTSLSKVHQMLKSREIGVIIIGVGSDVDTAMLQAIASNSKQGYYISAEGDQAGIVTAFQEVARLIGGQMILEDV